MHRNASSPVRPTPRAAFVLATIATLGPVPAMAGAAPLAQAGPPEVRVDVGDGSVFSYVDSPELAASGDSVYVVWEDDRDGESDIYFQRSLDGGVTWQLADVRLDRDPPGSAGSHHPQIAAVGDAVYVAWMDQRAGNEIYFNYSLDRGRTWQLYDKRLSRLGSPWTERLQIVASDDWVYVCWPYRRVDGELDIFFNSSANRGADWQTSEVRLDTDASGSSKSFLPRIAASGSSVFVAWMDERETPRSVVYLNGSLDGGTTWWSEDRSFSGGHRQISARVAVAGDDVFVVWSEDRSYRDDYDIYYNRSHDGGATWLARNQKLDGRENSTLPLIAVNGSSVHLVWTADGQILHRRSDDRGATWGLQTRVNSIPAYWKPQLAVLGDTLWVVWEDNRFTDRIYYNRSADKGSTWMSEDRRVDDMVSPGDDALEPRIAASGGSIYVVWREDTEAIYFNLVAGFQSYGAGKAGTGGVVPQLRTIGVPALSRRPWIAIDQARGGAPAMLLVGRRQVDVPFLDGALLVRPDAFVPIQLGGAAGTPGAGFGSIRIHVPIRPELIGANLNVQALVLDPGASHNVAMSDALAVWIG